MKFVSTLICLIQLSVAPLLCADTSSLERPNILWLTSEDNSIDWVGCYGNSNAKTPNIDQLAADGFQYMHAYASAPVCAPSRSTWITGINAISMGTHPMRSRYNIPHDLIAYYPDLLRANGYTVGNDKKTDYNIGGRPDADCWDNPKKVNWATLKQQQPFFQVINTTLSHESRAFGSIEQTKHDPAHTTLRAYHPDIPDMRKNYARYHDAVARMDAAIGASLQALEAAGLADNTIVIYNSDHGGVLPRSKRFLFSSGLHCPLIVRIPEKYKALWPADQPGTPIERIVSFVDMPKTWLSLTGSEIPVALQGTIFLGNATEPEPEYYHAFRGRMDERNDNARAIGDQQYLYIRNYMPYTPWMQQLSYLWKMKATQAWVAHVASGRASEVEARFFQPKGWTEELYDTRNDPDNVVNLASNPEFELVLARMRTKLRAWQLQVHDSGLLPESEMVKRAAEHRTTIYQMVRNPALYDLPALLDAADLALVEDASNLPKLKKLLDQSDCGLRYWGMVGCFLLNDVETARPALTDDSHEVRAMAAWLLVKNGEQEAGLACLKAMLQDHSYATLKILNILDWMDHDEAAALIPFVKQLKLKNYEERMQQVLVQKFANQ